MNDAGTQQTAGTKPASGSRKWLWMTGGTLTAVVVGGLMMQAWRAQPSQAGVEPARSGAPAKSSEIVARVERDVITYDLLAQECVARHGKEILDDIINRMIIQQACEKASVSVTEEEVTAEINRVAKRFNLDAQAWYQMLQAERNITPAQYRQSVIWPMLALRKLAGTQVDITEEELNQAFVRNYGPRVKARVIMFDNLRRAQEVWEKINRNPDDFEQMAQQHSIDPNSRALGGQVPPIPRFSGNEQLEQAAFKLKMSEISGIVQIGSSKYVILKCEGRTEQVVSNIDEVRDVLVDELKEQKTQVLVAGIFDRVKTQARVDNYLTQTSTGPERPTSNPGAASVPGAAPAGAIEQTGSVRLGNTPGRVNNAAGTTPQTPARR